MFIRYNTDMKKFLILIILIALAVAGFIFLGKDKKETTTDNIQTESEKVSVKDIKYSVPTKYTTYDVVYPEFSGVPAEFNLKIKNFILDKIKEHDTNSSENWKARHDTDPSFPEFPEEGDKFSFFSKYEIDTMNEKNISVALRFGGFEGGAHGYEDIITWNYDVANKKEMALKDFFSNDKDYLVTISKFARGKLLEKFKADAIENGATEKNWQENVAFDMLDAGVSPNIANFSNFTFDDKNITFYFPEYQVAPYAYGELKVEMAR